MRSESNTAPVIRRLDAVSAFNYVTAPEAQSYRAIVEVFAAAKRRYSVQLRPAEIIAALGDLGFEPLSDELLHARLSSLCDWGNLVATHDAATVSRLDEFYRRRLVYRLSTTGEAAHQAVDAVENAVEATGSLQATMLTKVLAALQEIAGLVAQGPGVDPDTAKSALDSLHTSFGSLAQEASRFIGELSRFLSQDELNVELFELRKHALISYLRDFVDRLSALSDPVRRAVQSIADDQLTLLVEIASRSSDLPPALAGESPARVFERDQRAKWRGVVEWFANPDGRSTERELHRIARESVSSLVHSLHRLRDRMSSRVDRAADFRTLARWFQASDDDDAAHQLFVRAFGLHSARHLHLAEDDPELTAPQTSWWDATPVAVPVYLRRRGTAPTAGRSGKVQDLSERHAWMREARRQARADRAAALAELRRALPDDRFGSAAALSGDAFALLLEFLDVALAAARGPHGWRTGETESGDCRVRLRPIPNSAPVTLRTDSGAFTVPWDAALHVEAVT